MGSEVEMPLQPILEKLPQDLRGKMTMRIEDLGDASIAISTEQIMSQLALGSVRITFGQLRGAAPDLFRVAEEYDSLPIVLPLNILLQKLNPNLLPRNPLQKAIAVPNEIKGPFGKQAEGVSFATSFMKAPPGPAARIPGSESQTKIQPRAVVSPPPAHSRPAVPPGAAPAAPVPPPPAPPQPSIIKPASPLPTMAKPSPPIPMAPTAPPPPPAPPKPMMPSAPIPMPRPAAPMVPQPTATPVEAAPVVFSSAATPAGAAVVTVPLSQLSEKWPEPLKAEARQLPETQVALQMNLLEPALRRGRVLFAWHYLRAWMSPKPPGASPNDGIELELPLQALVPLFLERYARVRPPMRVSVDRSIPNLFFGFPTAEMEAPVAAPIGEAPPPEPKPMAKPAAAPPLRAAIPAPAAPAAPVPPAPPAPAPHVMQAAQASDTSFYIPAETLKAPAVDQSAYTKPVMSDTEVKRRIATPKEIVERAMTVPGVAGAVIALPDGLKVAAQVPADVNSDTVAAFLPQIFDRVGQSTRELRMGALNNLKFTVGNVPWKIFRVNAVYFAAFGRAGERLPTAELAKLAAELDRKTK